MPNWLDGLGTIFAVVTAFFVSLTVVGVAVGFLLERVMPNRRIWSDPLWDGQLRHELIGNLVFLAVTIATMSALLHSGVVRFGPESTGRALATFGALYFGFQVFFFGLHWILHLPALVPVHRWHHKSRVTTALSAQSMSFGESIGWMGGYALLPLLFSYIEPISFEGLAAYLAFNVFGNIVGHANVELVGTHPGLRTRSLLATVFTYHALHHLRWTGHYGFASTWADRLFGTEWPDWMALHERVLAGSPMQMSEVKRVAGAAADGAPGLPDA